MAPEKSSGKGFAFVNSGSVLQGELLVENDLTVEGQVKGTIRATGTVSIGIQGSVEGEIQAATVRIGGKMTGNVTVTDRVVLEPKAVVVGDLKTRELIIHEGAHFHGNCNMQPGPRGAGNSKA